MKRLLTIMCLCCSVAFSAMQAQAATAPLVDSSQMDLSAINAIEGKSSGGVPVGTVIAWPVSSNPEDADKWLECNGQAISQAVYPELFVLAGGNVPNYEGMFLRGYGSQTYAGRTLKSGSLAAVQGDGVRIEPTDIKIKSGSMFLYRWSQSFKGTGANNDYTATFGNYIRKGGPVTGIEVGNLGSNEDTTRSVNRAVRYLIRALP